EPFRGKVNEPARVRLVAEKLAELRSEEFDALAAQTTANALKVYGIK
ncbi:MAG: TatD family hydrolase, partial [Clostridiales bacterium]